MSTVIALHPHRVERAARQRPGAQPQLRPQPHPELEPAGALRLTRRGQWLVRVVVTLAVVVCVLGGVLLLSRTAEAGSRPQQVPLTYHVVLPGETLWQIAGEVAPAADRRDTMARLRELNALDSGQLSVGQRIAVPA